MSRVESIASPCSRCSHLTWRCPSKVAMCQQCIDTLAANEELARKHPYAPDLEASPW